VSVEDAGWDSAAATATIWRGSRPVYDRGATVCVIGAGASGLAAIKNLVEQGFDVDCFERETGVAGAWNRRHDRSPVYASTHLVSSKPSTQYPDFPMPDDWPDYPHHSLLLRYLEHYADHFDLRRRIWFGTEVTRVEPGEEGYWDVTTRGARGGAERTARYAGLVIANGHLWSPNQPQYDGLGDYQGKVMHSSAYQDAAQLRGRKVLVVGAGNTGCDIAVEAAQQASKCWHSSRRGYWYAPKFVYGRPADQVNDTLLRLRVPLRLRQWALQRTLRRTVGDLTRFGLPAPDHKILETHPIVNSQLVYHLGHGDLTAVPDIKRFERHSVVLADDREIEPDLVVFATGYRPRFDFLAPDLLGADAQGRPRLPLHAFSRAYPTLFVAGMLQPDSGLFPLVHWQTVVMARWLRLRETDPARARAFWSSAFPSDERLHAGPVKDSSRHWFEVSHVVYLRALQRLLTGLETAR
jgi:cation diffusion facilitator CzcD-associated flavoprotein CzcO